MKTSHFWSISAIFTALLIPQVGLSEPDENNSPQEAEELRVGNWIQHSLNDTDDRVDWFRIQRDQIGRASVGIDLDYESSSNITFIVVNDAQNREEDLIMRGELPLGTVHHRRFEIEAERDYFIGIERGNGPDGNNDYGIIWTYLYSPLIIEPTIQSDTHFQAMENLPLTINFSAIHHDDNADIRWQCGQIPRGSSWDDLGDGTAEFNWTPDYSQGRRNPYEFIVNAVDGDQNEDSLNIFIRVTNVNRSPEYFGGFRDRTIQSGDPLMEDQNDNQRFVLEDSTTLFFSDPDEEDRYRLVFYIVSAPMPLNLQMDHNIVITSALNRNYWQTEPTLPITIACRDQMGFVARASFQVQVIPINDPPEPFDLVSPVNGFHLNDLTQPCPFVWENSNDIDDTLITYQLKIVRTGLIDTLVLDAGVDNSILIELDSAFNIDWRNPGDYEFLWSVLALDGNDSMRSNSIFRLLGSLEVSPSSLAPNALHLEPPFPNPFNSTVTITFSTGKDARPTRLGVYDVQGRLVADLLAEYPPFSSPPASRGGKQTVVWDASDMPAGIYFVRLEQQEKTTVCKILLLR